MLIRLDDGAVLAKLGGDAVGHLNFTVMLYVPKSEQILDYAVAVEISDKAARRRHGSPRSGT